MIKIRIGDVFSGFDDAEVVEIEETEENEVYKKGELNDYKQD